MNIIKLKIGQNSISNSIVKSKYTQNINTSEVKNLFGDSKLIDDYFLKGGYKVVSDIDCRNNISCEYRKLGMQVVVVGLDYSFKKYILKGNDPCSNEAWEELTNPTDEVGVKLVEDYSVLGDSLNTQRDLNLKLKQLILNLQTQIDLIELSDEKVQITENTSFANIGQTQKYFNKNISDKFNLKQDKLSSYDESILIETDGNIEGNVSLFEEYFEQQECELNFTPIQIVAVYQDGIKLLNSEYEIILPKKIKIKEYVDENIQIEYTHLKS